MGKKLVVINRDSRVVVKYVTTVTKNRIVTETNGFNQIHQEHVRIL